MGTNSIDEDRTLEFYHTVRNDGLEKIETKKNFFSQYYVGRQDNLCYRKVEFAVDKKPIANDIHHRKIIVNYKLKFVCYNYVDLDFGY